MKQSRLDLSINIRAQKRQRDLIDQAAERLGRSRSEFMLDAACRQAKDVLLDQRLFLVDAGACERVHRLLEKPLPATLKLRRLIETQPPWER